MKFIFAVGEDDNLSREYKNIRSNMARILDEIEECKKNTAPEITQEQLATIFDSLRHSDAETDRLLITLFLRRVDVSNNEILCTLTTEEISHRMVPLTRMLPLRNFDIVVVMAR